MILYVTNRLFLKPHHIGGWFVHDYLNDVLCLPIFIPIILRLQAAAYLRRHDRSPTVFEMVQNWLVFFVIYYFVLPRSPAFSTVADPWNPVAYALGGILAWSIWRGVYEAGPPIAGDPASA